MSFHLHSKKETGKTFAALDKALKNPPHSHDTNWKYLQLNEKKKERKRKPYSKFQEQVANMALTCIKKNGKKNLLDKLDFSR